ncbi:hypothetical protein SV7mr_17380 [Stieleria bergensis]|uniref:DUF2946 domain-containing protein n=1 Tax=Stieleria bergensis TaxID=2528025 RepID=A0A517SSY1_9BACT|nr:hypothetical protein SV7mr_17380 [Planctomycetes bacterium SV_7m_r]
MTPSLKSTLASLLCCLALLGHAPAWLHVAQCGDKCGHPTGQSLEQDEPQFSACAHGCLHHQATTSKPAEQNGNDPDPTDEPHDSESCVLCQSLEAPLGAGWEKFHAVLTGNCLVEPAIVSPNFYRAGFLAIPQPRGPPASV